MIDADFGLTARAAQHRPGFQDVVAQVTLGQVGLILSFDVTRLARNCSDWYPLLDLCGYKGCLIADRDGVYDPATTNGRLLLGLKGQLSELELHTIRARMTAGLLNKAARGELALTLPVGSGAGAARDGGQRSQSRGAEPHCAGVQPPSSACGRPAGPPVPRARGAAPPAPGSLRRRHLARPSVAVILAILKNPAYAGAFVYGRSAHCHPGT